MEIVERVARVLAHQHFVRNITELSNSEQLSLSNVDERWSDFQDDAVAILKSLRAPPETMRKEPEISVWSHIIRKALGPHAQN
jgi:hypothetical protein